MAQYVSSMMLISNTHRRTEIGSIATEVLDGKEPPKSHIKSSSSSRRPLPRQTTTSSYGSYTDLTNHHKTLSKKKSVKLPDFEEDMSVVSELSRKTSFTNWDDGRSIISELSWRSRANLSRVVTPAKKWTKSRMNQYSVSVLSDIDGAFSILEQDSRFMSDSDDETERTFAELKLLPPAYPHDADDFKHQQTQSGQSFDTNPSYDDNDPYSQYQTIDEDAEIDEDGQYDDRPQTDRVVEHGSNIRVEMPVNPAGLRHLVFPSNVPPCRQSTDCHEYIPSAEILGNFVGATVVCCNACPFPRDRP